MLRWASSPFMTCVSFVGRPVLSDKFTVQLVLYLLIKANEVPFCVGELPS